MKAIITVIGKDTVGILAKVSDACAKASVNIIEVTQSVLQDMFAMIMLVDIDKATIEFEQLRENLNAVGSSTACTVSETEDSYVRNKRYTGNYQYDR